ncbi:MAG: iron-sulfur cluster insertion protein ErpA [Gemmatimonadales bacterium]|jgi:iron-sulfur cluster assembly protein
MAQPQHAASLSLSSEAADKAREFLMQENLTPEAAGLRVAVLPGGCSGFQYGLNLEEEPREGDEIIVSNGIRLFVDPLSLQYLQGTVIGYHSSLHGSGFTFTNPNATGGCGCGSSFAV